MTARLNLSVALDTYDRTKPLVDGRVQPDGIELTPFEYRSPERHRRMLKYQEFDICELSFGSYLAGFEADQPYTGIPVFPHRKFRHGYYFVNADAEIETPRDLENKRIGIRRWQNTASLWMRGIARDYYDVDLQAVEWYIESEDEIPIDIPDDYATRRLEDDDNVNDMLISGELDAAMYPKRPSSFREGSTDIKRLFPNFKQEAIEYHRATGAFPIMHLLVIRDEIIDEHPWVPLNLRKAFEAAKHIALEELEHSRRVSLLWSQALLEEQQASVGHDPWPNNIEDNLADLERMIDYALSDGLLQDRVDPVELFVPSSTERLPGYS